MKTFKDVCLVLITLFAISYLINVYSAPNTNYRTTTQSSKGITAAQVAKLLENSTKRYYDNNYRIELDQQKNICRIDIWDDGIDSSVIERLRNGENTNLWNDMVSDVKYAASNLQQVFNSFGYDYITVVLNFCDPIAPDIIYLTVAQGVAGYDVVNGISLPNNPND